MTNIFSQKIKQDKFNIVYECFVNQENDTVGFTHINEYTNGREVLSIFILDFPSIREFISNGKVDYQNDRYQFIENECCYRLYSKKSDDSISIPKLFLLDSYELLRRIWVDD